MERSSFFNSVNHDRLYKAEDWAAYFASFIGNGVFPLPSSGLQVLAGEGMNVVIGTGKAWINGYFYFNTGDLSMTLSTADGVLKRIDRIVIRWDLQARDIAIQIKKGAYSAAPTPPALSRDADAYELALADVYVGAGAVAIGQAQITDRRLDPGLCGIVAGTVSELDTSGFNAQLQAMIAEYQSLSAEQYNGLRSYVAGLKIQGDSDYAAFMQGLSAFQAQAGADFQTWFQSLQGVLDDNAATNLYSLISVLGERVKLLEMMLFTGEIAGSPYMALLDDLDGVIADGVWNQGLRCLEC
jgi:hypothetical protein